MGTPGGLESYNAKSAVLDDLLQHEVLVRLPDNQGTVRYYLIIARIKVAMATAFINAFGPELSKLAMKVLGDRPQWCDYGVLFDSGFHIAFAFNLKFAQFNKKSGCVEYRDPQDVLADAMTATPSASPFDPMFPGVINLDEDIGPITKYGLPSPPMFGRPPQGSQDESPWNMVFRYALPDPADKKEDSEPIS